MLEPIRLTAREFQKALGAMIDAAWQRPAI